MNKQRRNNPEYQLLKSLKKDYKQSLREKNSIFMDQRNEIIATFATSPIPEWGSIKWTPAF